MRADAVDHAARAAVDTAAERAYIACARLPLAVTMKRPKGQRSELIDGAEALKARRERMKITQEELADLLGVGLNTVARWETAQREIPEMAIRLLDYVERDARQAAARRRRKAR